MFKPLSELATIQYGKSPNEVRQKDGFVPVYGTGGLVEYANTHLFSGEGVVVARKGTLDNPTFVQGDVWVIDTAYFVAPVDGVNAKWLYYQLQNFDLKKLNEATGVPSISRDYLYRVEFYTPDETVQTKIAEILSTIDNQIDATQALIDKYTAIKQGMMADLFSRGIDPETKALRPTFEEAPELYHETPLGMLPKGWGVIPASTICERVIDCKNRTPPEHSEGFAVIKTSNIKNGELIADSLTYTDEHSYRIWTARGVPQAGDVVITREAPVGESFLITDEMPSMCLGQRTMLYRPDPEAIQPMFMYFATRSPRFMKKLIDMAGGSTVGHVRVGDIKDMVFPKPNLSEQELISQACLAISDKLRIEKEFLGKLISQKSGLMQDLLTGKVPVPA
ncbi:restriction endonuclease subunit S [Vibrio parahaemolyticus]|nr:restriction endonuclease subunit S [Vibrio parahaemolyticus]ELA9327597.1 restriction endonuclease subunit S [Vibrio parahaemolyticus]